MKASIPVFGLSIILACGATIPGAAFAAIGNFTPSKNCPATKSLNKNDNPGDVTVKPGQSYKAINLNKPGGPYVLLQVQGAQPEQRWVEMACGTLGDGAAGQAPGGNPPPGANPPPATGEAGASSKPGKFLLAASWQPAFCESSAGQGKHECATETPDRYDASHFTLHGLWPQPNGNFYCNVSPADRSNDENHNWDALPEPPLSPETRAELDKIMPGTQSNLHRHEWIKHGTCFGTGPEAYFRTAEALLRQLNGENDEKSSELRKLMAGNIGKSVAAADLIAAFEKTFGKGAAGALAVECSKDGNRTLISGFSVNLQGVLSQATKLQSILDTSLHPKPKCAQGIVDPVGAN